MAALAGRGDCKVTAFRMGGPTDEQDDRLVHIDVPSHPVGRRVLGRRALRRQVAGRGVDVMLSPGTEVESLPGVPTLMWPLTVAPFEQEALQRLGASAAQRARWGALRWATIAAAQRADALIFSSHYARTLHVNHRPGLASKPSTVLPPSPTLEVDEASTSDDTRPYLLFVSHLYPYKMALELIEAFALARQAGVRHDLVIVGGHVDPRYSAQVQARVQELGVTECVHLPGSAEGPALAAWYAGASAFVFPSVSENAGSYALLDAFCAGLPVLSSSLSSMPEMCQDAARYFDPRSVAGTAELLVRVLSDPEVLERLRRSSRQRAAAFPTWEETAARLVSFARDVAGR